MLLRNSSPIGQDLDTFSYERLGIIKRHTRQVGIQGDYSSGPHGELEENRKMKDSKEDRAFQETAKGRPEVFAIPG